MDPASVPAHNTTVSETQTFMFTDLASSVEAALKQQAGAAAKSFEVFQAQPTKKFDFYLKPEVSARSVYDFWTYGCLMTYKLEILDKDGHLFASASGEEKRNFMFVTQAERKCSDAMKKLLDAVGDKALAKISR